MLNVISLLMRNSNIKQIHNLQIMHKTQKRFVHAL